MHRRFVSLLAGALALSLTATSVRANSTSERFDFGPIAVFNSCTGEIITVSATFHVVTTFQGNGNVKQHVNFHGQGTSPSGVKYQFGGNQKLTSDGPDFVIVARQRLIGQGPDNNEFIKATFSVIGGVPSSTFEIECR